MMSARRLDKSDPRCVSSVHPFCLPPSWAQSPYPAYEALLSGATLLVSTAIISPFPDLCALGIILSMAQILNIRPFVPAKESADMTSNAWASLLFALVITAFIAARKLLVIGQP
ncbi:hypothetical protein MSPP1_001597 [Malassezia sp. CBS 17886]|nr:hypothetical protein MSPP1_001597 [Malassezia sp. CBS 17886]